MTTESALMGRTRREGEGSHETYPESALREQTRREREGSRLMYLGETLNKATRREKEGNHTMSQSVALMEQLMLSDHRKLIVS